MVRHGEKLSRGFGSRYGPRIRKKYNRLRKEQGSSHKCPYCGYQKARRKAVGIWSCTKCESTFTSKAYRVAKVAPIKTAPEEAENE